MHKEEIGEEREDPGAKSGGDVAKLEATRKRRSQNVANYEQFVRYGLIIESEAEAQSWAESLAKETEEKARPAEEYSGAGISLARDAERIKKRLLRIGGETDPRGTNLEVARWQTLRALDQIDTFFRGSNQFTFDAPPSRGKMDKQQLKLTSLGTYTQLFDSMRSEEVVLDLDLAKNRRGRWLRKQAQYVIKVEKIPNFRLLLRLTRERELAKENPFLGAWFDKLYASVRFAYLTEESLILVNDIARAIRPHIARARSQKESTAFAWAGIFHALYEMHRRLRDARENLLSPNTRGDE